MLQKIKLNVYGDNVTLRKINKIFFINCDFNKKLLFTFYTKEYYKKIFNTYYINSYIIFFLKIIWRGKAYRVRFFKKKNKFTFNFGHSHWYKIVFFKKFFQFFKFKRQKYFVIYKCRHDRFFLIKLFNNIRKFNKYTRRGIRIKNTFFLRRFGKISQVNSILHSY